MGEKILVKICCGSSENVDFKEGKEVNFLKGLQTIFGENKTLHICSIINN